jgi:hypothetical protein
MKIVLLLGSIIVALLLAEGALRLFGYAPRVAHHSRLGQRMVREPAEGIPYLYEPYGSFSEHWATNPDGYFDEASSGVFYRVNNAGFRGEDFVMERGEAIRIALVGDSFCWGNGVKDQHHFAVRAAKTMNETMDLGRPVEIHNFGLGGYNTTAEVALFEHTVLAYEPDVCVIWYFLNDPVALGGQMGTLRYLGGDDRWLGIRKWSRVADAVLAPIDAQIGQRELIDLYQQMHRPGDERFGAVRSALARFAGLCAEHDVQPMLVIHPVLISLDERYPFAEAHAAVKEAAEAQGIVVVDLLESFKGLDPSALWVHPTDQHPNAEAHRIAGKALRKALKDMHEDGLITHRFQEAGAP